MKTLLSFILLTVISFTNITFADENCTTSSDKYVYQDEISENCEEQLKNNSLLRAAGDANSGRLSLITDTSFFKVAWDIAFNDKLATYQEYGKLVLLVNSIALFLIITVSLSLIFILIALVNGLFNAIQGKSTFGVTISAAIIKFTFVLLSKKIYFFCMSLGITFLLIFSYNIINIKKKYEISTESIQQIIQVSAEKDARQRVGEIIKYHTCTIQNDKRLLFDAHLTNNYKFDDSKEYHKCMIDSPSNTIAGIQDNSYNSLYFRKTLNCGSNHFGLEDMTCALTDFKKDNSIIKKAIEDNEIMLIEIANNFIKYACSNNIAYSSGETHQFYQYCFDFNPITREILYNENGQVKLISNAPTADELNAGVESFRKILVNATKESSMKNIKDNFTPKVVNVNELNAFMVFLSEDEDMTLMKMLSNQAHDYNFVIEQDMSFSKKNNLIQKVWAFFTEEGYKYPEIHERILLEIDYSSINKESLVQDIILPAVDFIGGDITQRLGINTAGNYTLRFNVIGSIMTAGINTSNNLLIMATTASVINKTASLMTTNRVGVKASFIAKKIEQISGTMSFLLWKCYLLAIGVFIFGLASVVKVICTAYFEWLANTLKLLNTKDAVLFFNVGGKQGIGFNEIGEKIVSYCYVALMPSIILLAFLMSLLVSYCFVFTTNNVFFDIIQSIGLFDNSDLGATANFLTAIFIYYFIILYLQYVIFLDAVNGISSAFILHISGSQERTMTKLIGVKGDERNMLAALKPKGRV